MPTSKTRDVILVAALVALATVMRLALFNGVYGHDDWDYLFYIRSFVNGQTRELLHSLWGLRYLFWFPIAAIFKVFGVSYWAAFLPGFLCGLATVPITYACIRKMGWSAWAAAAGCIALLFNPIDWMVSTTIRGDIEMSFYGGALLLLLLYFREMRGGRRLLIGLALGLVWGLSTLTKEWGFVFAWGFLGIALFDLVTQRRIPWEYAAVGAGFFAVLALDSVLLHAATGDWLARIKTSLGWYQHVANEGGYVSDRSKSLAYLPEILAGVRNVVTREGRFANGYPYYGIYMWLLLGALPLCLWLRGPARPVAWFVASMLLWIEFGSMSWTEYLPYHKEPRYFAIISVPTAIMIVAIGTRLWHSRARYLQPVLIATALIFAWVSFAAVRDENREYTAGRDFIPALVPWLEQHPQARIWVEASIQSELDLRLGYRFGDLVHQHAGAPGYGSVFDLFFWKNYQHQGDYVLISKSWASFRGSYPPIRSKYLDPIPVATLSGPSSVAMIYRVTSGEIPDEATHYLSDLDPAEIEQTFSELHYDCNVSGLPISLAGVHYAKGLGVHAWSKVTYKINKKFALFSSVIGVDDSEQGGGTVVFEVWLDDRLAYKSRVLRSAHPPESIWLDVTGVTTLKLVVTDAGDGISGDHGDWAGATLTKAP